MRERNFFDRANDFIRNTETSLVNFLSAVAPWAAPLAPAYLSWNHMRMELAFPVWVAWSVAIVVEILGLSAISTILAFWMHNRRYKKDGRKAPVIVPGSAFIFYLLVILTINVMLEAAKIPGFFIASEWVRIIAIALLTLLSVPAAIIIAVRTLHHQMLDGIEQEKAERRQTQARPRSEPASNNGATRRKSQFFLDVQSGRLQNKLDDSGLSLTAKTIADLYGVSERNAFRWLKTLKRSD
jgi:hypothetical protein